MPRTEKNTFIARNDAGEEFEIDCYDRYDTSGNLSGVIMKERHEKRAFECFIRTPPSGTKCCDVHLIRKGELKITGPYPFLDVLVMSDSPFADTFDNQLRS
jgi:hypothetical protein